SLLRAENPTRRQRQSHLVGLDSRTPPRLRPHRCWLGRLHGSAACSFAWRGQLTSNELRSASRIFATQNLAAFPLKWRFPRRGQPACTIRISRDSRRTALEGYRLAVSAHSRRPRRHLVVNKLRRTRIHTEACSRNSFRQSAERKKFSE